MNENNIPPEHYYGDLVRKFFLTAAGIMVIGLPFILPFLPWPTLYSIVAIIVLGVLAGLTSPRQTWVIAVNTGVSIIAFLMFESYAIRFYNLNESYFFVMNQLLALIFLASTYYSTKTWRGMNK